jgi:hypothetical protein
MPGGDAGLPQPALEPLRRWDPEQIVGYVLVGRLGAGAMGRVYLPRSAAGRLIAVKTIKVELAEEPGFRNRFAQEVAAARRVSGAFTAAVVSADPEADVPWLATAYVPAPTLSRLVRACGALPVPAVRWLAAGCAEALESIHGAGLVHRDLKPSNVLVSPDGPRVIDFGVARAAERIQLTVTRGAVGTPAYMAPEQARDTRQATMASDVFSLGATTVFAATGHAPYQGETVMDVLVRLATEAPDLSGLPADLADIVRACLDRDPRGRPGPAMVLARLRLRHRGQPPASAASTAAWLCRPPAGQLSARPGAGPQVTLYQNSGDGNTVFVLHGPGLGARPGAHGDAGWRGRLARASRGGRRRDVQLRDQPGPAALDDLAAQHLEMLADPRGQPVAEGRVAVEARDLVVGVGDLERRAGDLGRPGQRGAPRRIDQPWPAPHQGHQEELGVGVEVKREQGRLPAGPHGRALGLRAGHAPRGDDQAQRLALVEHGA